MASLTGFLVSRSSYIFFVPAFFIWSCIQSEPHLYSTAYLFSINDDSAIEISRLTLIIKAFFFTEELIYFDLLDYFIDEVLLFGDKLSSLGIKVQIISSNSSY